MRKNTKVYGRSHSRHFGRSATNPKPRGLHARHRHRVRRPHPRRLLQRRLRQCAGTRPGQGGGPGRPPARPCGADGCVRSHPRADPHRGAGAESGAPSFDERWPPVRDAGLDRQPAMRLGPACGGAGLPADRQWRCRYRGGGRSGIDEPGAARGLSARRPEDGRARVDRHHAEGRFVGGLPGYHIGVTAENVGREWQIPREQQDRFAVASQNKAEAARKSGRFNDEIAPVTVKERKGERVVDTDKFIRDGVTYDGVSGLKPAFQKDGTVTAANASGINDGAAAVVLMTDKEARSRGLKPLGRIASWAHAGVDPAVMGSGPIPASRAALKKAGWSVEDLDLIEANEAFAAQACAVNKDLGWDAAKVNVNGGAIAIGHPIGASGARVLTTLLYEMGKRDAKKGLATLCIGGGMGIALCVGGWGRAFPLAW